MEVVVFSHVNISVGIHLFVIVSTTTPLVMYFHDDRYSAVVRVFNSQLKVAELDS